MTDIRVMISKDGSTVDWCSPLLLAQPLDNSQDLETLVTVLLSTDRVAPIPHFGLQHWERRGSWHDGIVGEFGSGFWMKVERNLWGSGSKLAQIVADAQLALDPLYTVEQLIQSQP